MALPDFIKRKIRASANDDAIEEAVLTFENYRDDYSDKSLSWVLRITADKLDITKDELCSILDNYYGDEEE